MGTVMRGMKMTNKVLISPKDIDLEVSLLQILASKHYFDYYIHFVDHNRALPTTSLLLKDYKKYFDLYPEHTTVDFGQFITQFTQNWHNKDLDQMDIEYYKDYVFPKITGQVAEHDTGQVEKCLLGLINKATTEELLAVANKTFSIKALRDILDEHEKKQTLIIKENDADVFTMENVDFSTLDRACGLPYFLPSIQEGLGSLVKGQFVVVSADYGSGKSAFVINQAVHSLKHLIANGDERPILYFNSEGTEGDVFARFLSNLYNCSRTGGFEEIIEKREEVREEFLSNHPSDQFMVFQISGKGLAYVRTKLQKYKPALVIIDITDVLAPEEDVTNLKKIYDQLRLLSGEYCPIIGTTQAGDNSYLDKETNQIKNRKWLGDKALYGSKSGKGGAADTIITIGKDDNNPSIRYVATPKKKRGTMVNVTCELIDKYSLYKELTF